MTLQTSPNLSMVLRAYVSLYHDYGNLHIK